MFYELQIQTSLAALSDCGDWCVAAAAAGNVIIAALLTLGAVIAFLVARQRSGDSRLAASLAAMALLVFSFDYAATAFEVQSAAVMAFLKIVAATLALSAIAAVAGLAASQQSGFVAFLNNLPFGRAVGEAEIAALREEFATRTASLSEQTETLRHIVDSALEKTPTAISAATQDRNLRFTWAHRSMMGFATADAVGRTDADVLPAQIAAQTMAMKQLVLTNAVAMSEEFVIGEGGVEKTYQLFVEPIRDRSGALTGLLSIAVDLTERRSNEARLRELLLEVSHRSKNTLAVLQSLARQSARRTTSTEEFLSAFLGRVQALSDAQDVLVQEDWAGAPLDTLISRAFKGHGGLSFDGGPLRIQASAAHHVGIAIHELATNALLHGALLADMGRVTIAWSRPPDGENVEVIWTETGGPRVQGAIDTPPATGLGLDIARSTFERVLEGRLKTTFGDAGVEHRIEIPARHFA